MDGTALREWRECTESNSEGIQRTSGLGQINGSSMLSRLCRSRSDIFSCCSTQTDCQPTEFYANVNRSGNTHGSHISFSLNRTRNDAWTSTNRIAPVLSANDRFILTHTS